MHFWTICLLGAGGLLSATAAERSWRVTIDSGAYDRRNSVAAFELPVAARSGAALLDESGAAIPLQVDAGGRGWFLVSEHPRGRQTYRLTRGRSATPEAIRVRTQGGAVKIVAGDQDVLEYHAEKSALPRPDIKSVFQRGGYVHPLYTPSGRVVTDHYPANHLHQNGIWFAWTRTEFEGRSPDFWNLLGEKGRVEVAGLHGTWNGPVHGGFAARHQHIDLTSGEPKPVLEEFWYLRVYRAGEGPRPYFMVDLESRQACIAAAPLKLPQYHYGGLGFRGPWNWNGKENTLFLTSEGETNRLKGNETRARWCHISGLVNGTRSGTAILCHPENFRAPQPMRLHPSEPFFCYAPSQLGDWEIQPGHSYVSRYRFIVMDGDPDRAELDRFWNDYAHPVVVRVE